MAKANITVSVEHDGLSYVATLDRNTKTVEIVRGDGETRAGEWDGEIWGVSTGDPGEWPTMAITKLDEALRAAYASVLRGA